VYQDYGVEAEGKRQFGRSSMDGRIMLKWILKVFGMLWDGFI
jgi:hypothetical protein